MRGKVPGTHPRRGAERVVAADDDRRDAERDEQESGEKILRMANERHAVLRAQRESADSRDAAGACVGGTGSRPSAPRKNSIEPTAIRLPHARGAQKKGRRDGLPFATAGHRSAVTARRRQGYMPFLARSSLK